MLFPKISYVLTAALLAATIAFTACGGSVQKSSSSPPPVGITASPAGTSAPGGSGGSSGTGAPGGGGSSGAPTANASASPAPSGGSVFDQIQDRDGWVNCLAAFSDGYPCAAGMGQADAWMAQHQTNPSMSGQSAEFHIGGATPYSNSLWWVELGANNNAAHFIYDFWVYTPNPERPQALEFDVNQSFGGTRWVFGTECNFAGDGKWDVWDSSEGQWGKWKATRVSCPRLKPNTWTHAVWKLERSGSQVHYISVAINGTEYSVDMWLGVQRNFPSDTINVAVQLDGDYQQQPYEVFVDNMRLTYW